MGRFHLGWLVIDWTISVGSLLQVVAFLVTGVGAFFALRSDIKVLTNDVKNLQQEQIELAKTMREITTVMTTMAVQQVRLDRAEKTIDEMRHGQGFVNPMRS